MKEQGEDYIMKVIVMVTMSMLIFYYDKDKVRVNIDFFEEDKWPKYGYLGYYLLKDRYLLKY